MADDDHADDFDADETLAAEETMAAETLAGDASLGSTTQSDIELFEPGERIEHYEIQEKLGSGGMAVVYRALDTVLQRTVAIKFLHKHLYEQEGTRERFVREARAAAQVSHPNVVSIYAIGNHQDHQYMVLEFVDGHDLNEHLKTNGPMEAVAAAEIAYQCAQGLQAIHRVHVVHRDIKPHNIFLTEQGSAKLGDLGLARSSSWDDEQQELTSTGEILGTPAYISPEQVKNNEAVDIRSDIHALGGTLYTLLTNKRPFAGNSLYELCDNVVKGERPNLKKELKTLDDELADIVHTALAREADDRFQDPQQMAEALGKYLDIIIHKDDAKQKEMETRSSQSLQQETKATIRTLRHAPEKLQRILIRIGAATVILLALSMVFLVGSLSSSFSEDSIFESDRASLVRGSDNIGEWLDLRFQQHQFRFRVINAGDYKIGSPKDERQRSINENQHSITLSNIVWICEHECTQLLWSQIYQSELRGDPKEVVHSVTWHEAQNCVETLANVFPDTIQVRLPSESEWEIACRAGTVSAFNFGDHLNYLSDYCNFADKSSGLEWAETAYEDQQAGIALATHFKANQWGFYDMHGNVWEWCQDSYLEKISSKSKHLDPIHQSRSSSKVLRGGSWKENSNYCRSASRKGSSSKTRSHDIGFRIAIILPKPTDEQKAND